jgi:V/A-type H+-transporting ATPase subunit K
MKRVRNICTVTVAATLLLGVLSVGTAMAQVEEHTEAGGEAVATMAEAAPYYAIAVTMGVACLSAAYAVGKVGAAALGAAAEKPELLGKAIVFVGLGEGIAIFGLIISLMLINKI